MLKLLRNVKTIAKRQNYYEMLKLQLTIKIMQTFFFTKIMQIII